VVLQGGRQDAERLFQPTADDVDGLRVIGGEDNLARVSAKKPGPFSEWVTSAEFYWSTLAKRPSIGREDAVLMAPLYV